MSAVLRRIRDVRLPNEALNHVNSRSHNSVYVFYLQALRVPRGIRQENFPVLALSRLCKVKSDPNCP
jgi:hypothetical protein